MSATGKAVPRLALLAVGFIAMGWPATAEAASGDGIGKWLDARPAALRLHAPSRQLVELGVYVGLLFPSRKHELYDPRTGFQRLEGVMGDLGVRVGYYPLSWMGAEFEAGGFPGRTERRDFVGLWTARGHFIFQLPLRIAPFVLGGLGMLGVSSNARELGDDIDPAWHVGLGIKFYVTDLITLRFEIRDSLSNSRDTDTGPASHVEMIGGIAFTFGRAPGEPVATPPPQARAPQPLALADKDKDGIADRYDKCPEAPGLLPHGCPRTDSDADGFIDRIDRCQDVPGVYPYGCPTGDDDLDGFVGEEDKCPGERGLPPDGCRGAGNDADNDGIPNDADRCPNEPETRNAVDDEDGCPDERPAELAALDGVIEGIRFGSSSARLSRSSLAVLDNAAAVLKRYPDLRFEIVGHTDTTGPDEVNRGLSQKRAEAVRKYLIKAGLAPDRITTRGAGEDEPIASNDTAAGRARNRRTEFRLAD